MKKLSQLLTSIKPLKVVGDTDIEITDLVNDSRKAREGALFVAVKGVAVDSHRFIDAVIASGARAIVCEDMPQTLSDSVTYVQVENSVIALAHLADEWFDHPSKALRLVGVTGTNGKTTTATLLYEMSRLMGHKAGLLSTVKNIIDTVEQTAVQTTPLLVAFSPTSPVTIWTSTRLWIITSPPRKCSLTSCRQALLRS